MINRFNTEILAALIVGAALAHMRSYLSQQDQPNFSIPVFQYLSLAVSALQHVESDKLQIALDDICQRLDITDKLSRNIQQLSGGEWQRVRLAAACLQVWPTITLKQSCYSENRSSC